MNRPSARTGNDHQLLIQTLTPSSHSPLQALGRRITDAGCNLADIRLASLGVDTSVTLLATGAWDAVAKLETALSKLAREEDWHLTYYRTTGGMAESDPDTPLLPYLVEVISIERPGMLVRIVDFFDRRSIRVEQFNSLRYRAIQTGASMFQAQITLGIPAQTHIAALRDEFLEFCDGLNLDAIMDPVKF
ncbi:glycine cleavage system protein R [Dyella sp.]|uniref:glycine cleavage system protein R n=1 Tax=Dyella sp. TaxID=1869338 RepID=UPI002ED52CF6